MFPVGGAACDVLYEWEVGASCQSMWVHGCADEWMFWQWVRELCRAHGSHPCDGDVFDTRRQADQNTPPLQYKVGEQAGGRAISVCVFCRRRRLTSNRSCPSTRMSVLIWRIGRDGTKRDESGLGMMSPHWATTIDVRVHIRGHETGDLTVLHSGLWNRLHWLHP